MIAAFSQVLALVLIGSPSPEQMDAQLQDLEKMDCKKMVESIAKQCSSRCATASSKKDVRKKCIQHCNDTAAGFEKNCKDMKEGMKYFRGKSKEEQRRMLQEGARGDHHHD